MRIASLAVLFALVAGPPALGEETPDFASLKKAFEQGFVLGGDTAPAREELRAKKRDAVVAVRAFVDPRSVTLLLDAHRKQGRFVDALLKDWEARREKHMKLAPAMEKALQARSAQTPPGQQMLVSQAEKAWIDEKTALEGLRADAAQEEEIGEFIRRAAGSVLSRLEGEPHAAALREVLKAVGKGETPEERDFIRLLGYVAGGEVTQALRRLADDPSPFVVMIALEALGRQGDPDMADLLLERLSDPRWQVRVAALQGLSFRRQARIVDTLIERGRMEDGVLVRHYLTALARILETGEAGPAPTIEGWCAWWRENRDRVVEAWEKAPLEGPVEGDLPPVALRKKDEGGTSFYGIQTQSKHIVFVIDISGSMGEHGGVDEHGKMRIDVVKAELTNAIRALTAEDEDERGPSSFNIVAYAATVTVFQEGKMVPATKANKEKAFAWIQALRAEGATNIFDALERAFEIVDTRRASKQMDKGADTIFLMTDGEPNRGKIVDPLLICAEIAKMNRERKITLHAIGVGKDHKRDFLERLASENQGEYLGR